MDTLFRRTDTSRTPDGIVSGPDDASNASALAHAPRQREGDGNQGEESQQENEGNITTKTEAYVQQLILDAMRLGQRVTISRGSESAGLDAAVALASAGEGVSADDFAFLLLGNDKGNDQSRRYTINKVFDEDLTTTQLEIKVTTDAENSHPTRIIIESHQPSPQEKIAGNNNETPLRNGFSLWQMAQIIGDTQNALPQSREMLESIRGIAYNKITQRWGFTTNSAISIASMSDEKRSLLVGFLDVLDQKTKNNNLKELLKSMRDAKDQFQVPFETLVSNAQWFIVYDRADGNPRLLSAQHLQMYANDRIEQVTEHGYFVSGKKATVWPLIYDVNKYFANLQVESKAALPLIDTHETVDISEDEFEQEKRYDDLFAPQWQEKVEEKQSNWLRKKTVERTEQRTFAQPIAMERLRDVVQRFGIDGGMLKDLLLIIMDDLKSSAGQFSDDQRVGVQQELSSYFNSNRDQWMNVLGLFDPSPATAAEMMAGDVTRPLVDIEREFGAFVEANVDPIIDELLLDETDVQVLSAIIDDLNVVVSRLAEQSTS